MDTNSIVAAISKISRKKTEQIEPHLSLASLGVSSSFGLSALRSLLEAQARSKLPPLRAHMTVADILQKLIGSAEVSHGSKQVDSYAADPESSVLKPIAAAPDQGKGGVLSGTALDGLALGMDMQEISALPLASDYRTDEFYTSHFVPQEIATSLLRPESRAHLCGIFCVKEAAKKSRPELLNLRMTDFFVTHDGAGRPSLHIAREHPFAGKFRFLISITHTAEVAAATCITVGTE
jgi:phosphopantetheine--protein transferase-like protein